MTRYVAFLRGINLAGKRRVGMADLRAALARAGYGEVRTYLQSGNVVLDSEAAPHDLEGQLETLLGEEFRFPIAVLVRSCEELAEAIANDPFAGTADDPRRYLVTFLSAPPESAVVRRLEEAALPPERVAVRGREIYSWHPAGIGRSPLAKEIDARRLGVEVTARNWRTLTKLQELCGRAGDASP